MCTSYVCFVFSPLSSLRTFPALWLRILDFMDRYLNTERSDLLCEAVPESLKNMILVLDNTGMFLAIPGLFQVYLSIYLFTCNFD